METALTAIIIIFIILFAVLTLSDTFVSTQDILAQSWQEMEARLDDQARTELTFLDAYTSDGGTFLTLTLRNEGTVKLIDFAEWDLILQYYDAGSDYHINRLSFRDGVPSANEWVVDGLYVDTEEQVDEVYEPSIFNPGEEIVLRAKVSPPIAPGATILATVSVGSGVTAATNTAGNMPPELETNEGMTLASGDTGTITAALLAVTDADDADANLTYTISAAPVEGTLNLGDTFTQADINNGLLDYTHTGSGNDSFEFTVSDGKDSATSFTFDITVDTPPTLSTNAGLTITGGGTGAIGDLLLETTDAEASPDSIIYTVTHGPFQGLLSLSDTFTQQDILDGYLAYSHYGTGNDRFAFYVTDGISTIGPFTFDITIN
jgi:hypothetical protein